MVSHNCGGGARWWSYRKWRHRKWRYRKRSGPEVTEVSAGACADFPCAFFLTIVVRQNVGTRDPEGVPLGARMRNRFPPFFRVFWPEMTFPVELKKTREKTTTTKKKKAKNKKQFEKVREKSTGKCFISSCTRKASNWYFKRCGLKKYGKMYCFLKSITRKTSNESI